MEQLKKRLVQLKADISTASTRIKLDDKQKQLVELNEQISEPDFWNDSVKAQQVSKQQSDLHNQIKPWQDLAEAVNEALELTDLNDRSMTAEITNQADKLEQEFDSLKKQLRFSGPYDDHNVILSIYAGAGGTDAQDWAQMLLRMYVRWAETSGIKVQTIDQTAGEEAGIKSATIEFSGAPYLYGKLAGEHGVHRMVRKSPFNSAGSRETSFAKVEIMPEIDKPEEVVLDDKDLKVDVYRAGGHGGQSVNTTDSAVRITHIPTGISVAIQNERSQLQNKETALKILRSKLVAMQAEQHAEHLSDLKGPSQSAEWGNQIRSYVLDDKIVKDSRSGFESHNPDKILDGNLEPLIDAWLDHKPA